MFDVVIAGAGPAGLNAALVLGRARRHVLVLDAGPGRNAPAEGSHNLLSRDGIPPEQLQGAARADLRSYPSVEVREIAATGIGGQVGAFNVDLADGTQQEARQVLLATGMADVLPDVEGLRPLWGRSVLHCPYCHGWEVRDRALAVLVAGPMDVLMAARLASGYSEDVIACTSGEYILDEEQVRLLSQVKVAIREEPISRLEADGDALRRIVFSDGAALDRDALFVHPQLRQRSDLAARLGCRILEDDAVEVNDLQQTGVPGVSAAGDMARRPSMLPGAGQQVGIAAAEGLLAAMVIDHELAFGPLDTDALSHA
jgi:thioredoxin reductase